MNLRSIFDPWSVMNEHVRENARLRTELARETLLVEALRHAKRGMAMENEKLYRRVDEANAKIRRLEADLKRLGPPARTPEFVKGN